MYTLGHHFFRTSVLYEGEIEGFSRKNPEKENISRNTESWERAQESLRQKIKRMLRINRESEKTKRQDLARADAGKLKAMKEPQGMVDWPGNFDLWDSDSTKITALNKAKESQEKATSQVLTQTYTKLIEVFEDTLLTPELKSLSPEDEKRKKIRELATTHAADFMRHHASGLRENMSQYTDATVLKEQLKSELKTFLAKKIPEVKNIDVAKQVPPETKTNEEKLEKLREKEEEPIDNVVKTEDSIYVFSSPGTLTSKWSEDENIYDLSAQKVRLWERETDEVAEAITEDIMTTRDSATGTTLEEAIEDYNIAVGESIEYYEKYWYLPSDTNEMEVDRVLWQLEIDPTEYVETLSEMSTEILSDPTEILSLPAWETVHTYLASDTGVDEVVYYRTSGGDVVFHLPEGIDYYIDANGDEEKIKEEFEFMKTLLATPILRRSLYSWVGAFRTFQNKIYTKYQEIPAVRTSEWFVDIALSEIFASLPDDLEREEKRVVDYLKVSLNTRWNLSQTQDILRNNRNTLLSCMKRNGLIRESSGALNLFSLGVKI
jgi:hypothetical protein